MKKHLLASTALVAAGVLASSANAAEMMKAKKPMLSLGGYYEATVGGVLSQKHDQAFDPGKDNAAVDVHNEAEVHFNGRATLDNGITILTRVELEADGDGTPGERNQNAQVPVGGAVISKTDVIDQTYMIIRGSFGEINLGAIDSAGYRTTIGYSGSWATGVGQNLVFDVAEWIDPVDPRGSAFNPMRDSRLRDLDDDAEKISYFTPRFAGFQIGVSYVPNNTQDINNSMADASVHFHDGVSVGGNFDRKIGNVGVGIAAGYHRFSAPESKLGVPSLSITSPGLTLGLGTPPGTVSVSGPAALGQAGTQPVQNKDPEAAVIAMRFDFGPFRIAGSYKRTMSEKLGAGTGGDFRGRNFDVGARYVMGPNQFSFGYLNGKLQIGTDEYQAGILSYARILGPGVKWYASLLWNDSKRLPAGIGGRASKNDGYALSSGVRLTF